MKIVVAIPTYNEAETIGRVLDKLLDVTRQMLRHDWFILVVDGNSPDGTGDIVTERARNHPNIVLLTEKEKAGLGAAYTYAFKHAMTYLNADVVIEMDADLQHDPEDVLRLVEKIDEGYDYVIGSRFIQGGSIPQEWQFYRKFLSRGGNKFSKMVLGVTNVTDFTSGFKATRVSGFLDQIDLDTLLSKGFAYKMDLLYRMSKMGAKIAEIPIKFHVRTGGESKMARTNTLDSLFVVLQLRARDSKSFLLFLVVGLIGLFVDLFVFNSIVFLSTMGIIAFTSQRFAAGSIASLVSGFIAMFTTYVLNNRWTFSDRRKSTAAEFMISVSLYYMSSYVPIVLRSWLIGFMVEKMGDTFLINNVAMGIGILFGVIWNFTVYSKFIWKKTKSRI